MALNGRLLPTAGCCGFCHRRSDVGKHGRLHTSLAPNVGVGGDLACRSIAVRSRSSLDRRGDGFRRGDDGAQRARAVAPRRRRRRSVCDPGFQLGIGDEALGGGSSLLFPGRSAPAKLVVAVDVDEVLGNFVSALNKFIADRYAANHTVSEYYVYEFFKIWKCSRNEANIRVHEFFETSYFKSGIHPIPGAQHVLHKLSTFCDLSVVTSRQDVIKDHTLEWIEEHYPRLFQEIHFGNHFALNGQSRPKSEICRSLGAHVLIDDNPQYALECAEVGIRALLFDYDNSYPWSKTGSAASHPLVTKVYNWEEVEHHLVSLALSLGCLAF